MRRLLPLSIALGVLVTPALLEAAVFPRDWKTPGDGLLTYDDVNKREWLDLSASAMQLFPGPRLANALAQLEAGGRFEGFRLANRDDVFALALSAGLDLNTEAFDSNGSPVANLLAMLAPTLQTSQTSRALGYINAKNQSGRQLGADFFVNTPSGGLPAAGLRLPANDDILVQLSSGLFLYRFVPEPTSLYLLLFSLAVFASVYRAPASSHR